MGTIRTWEVFKFLDRSLAPLAKLFLMGEISILQFLRILFVMSDLGSILLFLLREFSDSPISLSQ